MPSKLKKQFAAGSPPDPEELRGYYAVRLVTGFLPALRFFGHRKFFPVDAANPEPGSGGFNEFANLVKREAESFSESETGQRFRSDINEFGDRIRSAEAREKVRLEVLSIMQNANAELRKVIDKWSPAEPTEDPNTDKDQSQEASEDREATGTDG